jgi:hypothetical protein
MFWEILSESVAGSVFWLLVIGGVTMSLRYLIRDILDYILEDDGKSEE